jgi:hypothetical protein
MPAGIKNVLSFSAISFIAGTVLTASTAVADTTVTPVLSMSITSSDYGTVAFNPSEFGDDWQNANGTFGFAGSTQADDHWALGWSMLVNPDPFVIANYVVTNNSATTQTFTLEVLLPYTEMGPFCKGGSVTGSVTDLNGDGATVSSLLGGSIYSAIIDNNVVMTLLDGASTTTGPFLSGTIGPASFGDPIPSMQYIPDITTNIGINLTFTLTAGDSASFTSIFVVEPGCIPAPGALAMLAVAGLMGGRRRRS